MKIKRPGWRKMTWVVLLWNLAMIVWIIGGLASAHNGQNCQGLSSQVCNDAANVGAGLGVALIVMVWIAGDIILGILWLVTNRKKRLCPACGVSAKTGVTKCAACGHDFAAAAALPKEENQIK